ncbi:MAG: HEPN domain-containing protein [Hyphomicrobiales bacterium]|nr:HEPN domain-containing protein [Hyphomicrobiales bacterium]
MISGKEIKKVLEWIKERYDNPCTRDVYESRLYSKLAILELSGWVEGTLKDLAIRLIDKKLNDDAAKEEFKEVIRNIRGFRYERHFQDLLNKTVGFINREIIEKEISGKDYDKLEKFKTALNNLSGRRNFYAHNFSHNPQKVPTTIDPSSVINYYEDILSGLEAFKEEIAKNQGISF